MNRCHANQVVNCFQNCIFDILEQRNNRIKQALNVVNCFQNCIFDILEQHAKKEYLDVVGCELLSKLYL